MTGSATAYVVSGEVTDANTDGSVTGDVTATRFYTFGGATVAARTDDGQLSLLLGDEQGSTSVMMPVPVDASGVMQPASVADAEAAVRTAYTPFGELRGVDNAEIDRGWLGQVEDAGTGLTYLNARYYDPVLQRFLSPDPLMNPGDPRTLDAYRYAENNPVVYLDPTGLRIDVSGTVRGNDEYYSLHPTMTPKTGVSRNHNRGLSPAFEAVCDNLGVICKPSVPEIKRTPDAATPIYPDWAYGELDPEMPETRSDWGASVAWYIERHGAGRGTKAGLFVFLVRCLESGKSPSACTGQFG